MIEYTATNSKGETFAIKADEPTFSFEQIELATKDGSRSYTFGNHRRSPLNVEGDIEFLIDHTPFTLKSKDQGKEWIIENCYVCADRKSIHYSRAYQPN